MLLRWQQRGSLYLLAAILPLFAATSYREEVEAWRKAREASFRSEEGWLTIVGLHWLTEGDSLVGTDPSSQIVLPPGSAAFRVGTISYRGGRVSFRAAPGSGVTLNGESIDRVVLKPNSEGQPDVLRAGRLSMWVIERGGRHALRVRDPESPMRKHFQGLEWFEVDERWRIKAKWVAYERPRPVKVQNIVGLIEEQTSPGYAVFTLAGKQYRLEPTSDGDRLFFVFRDATAGKETYPGGRFLYADPPVNGYVVLDFNKAYNPPCAFNPYTTCPLPLPQNRLAVRIPAGEKYSPKQAPRFR